MTTRGCPRISGMYTVDDVYKLRDSTPIGSEIKFKDTDSVTISGIVTDKYEHVFVLDNKRTYDWKQYMLNKN